MNEIVPIEGEIVKDASALLADNAMAGTLARAEIDAQITTARVYPRSLKIAIDNILTLATLDEQTAVENIYVLKRGGKPLRGPSIRLAEIIAQQWGNCRVDGRVISIDRQGKTLMAEGTFHDLQTNVATRATVTRSISTKEGRLFSHDMIAVAGQAATAIARRNAILSGVPRGVWRKAVDASEDIIRGDLKTMQSRRDTAMAVLAQFGISAEQVFTILEVKGLDDIGLDDLVTLNAIRAAIKNGEQTVDELLASKTASAPVQAVSDPLGGDAPKKPAQATQKAPAAQQAQAAINPAPEHAPQAEAQDKPVADDAKASSESMPERSDAAGDSNDDIPADDGPTQEQRKEMERIGQLHSQARLKSAKGGKVFGLWLKSISPADQEALVPIKDELWGRADDFDAKNAAKEGA